MVQMRMREEVTSALAESWQNSRQVREHICGLEYRRVVSLWKDDVGKHSLGPIPFNQSSQCSQTRSWDEYIPQNPPPSNANMPSSHLLLYGLTKYLSSANPRPNSPRRIRFQWSTSTTQDDHFKSWLRRHDGSIARVGYHAMAVCWSTNGPSEASYVSVERDREIKDALNVKLS